MKVLTRFSIVVSVIWGLVFIGCGGASVEVPKHRTHLDHSAFFKGKKFNSPQEVTRACLECHKKEGEDFMKTPHWLWLGAETALPDRPNKKVRLGKKNVINNFCISIIGNWAACTKCHAGYGWKDNKFDFSNPENVDCLICHDWSGTYVKKKAGIPPKNLDLAAAAASVGYPKRENCNLCHSYGGGGLAVKHGDLDTSLDNPTKEIDVHMGKYGMLCIDCHSAGNHVIRGTMYSVDVNHSNGFSCADCHGNTPHKDQRLNSHTATIACQTCHVPKYAKMYPTKMWWDWSKAGDPNRKEDHLEYLKIKGEFIYDADLVPEYYWFNLTVSRYLLGDKFDPSEAPLPLNLPLGSINDKHAKLWPFKVHRATQPYDKKLNHLLTFRSSGEGGFWHEFDWQKAIKLGAKDAGLDYSGEYGFIRTDMYWPLSHMVAPKEEALTCGDCHGKEGRIDWQKLGYPSDPMFSGGRQ